MGFIVDRITEFGNRPFIRYGSQHSTYEELGTGIASWLQKFPDIGVKPGDVVSVVARFCPSSIMLLLALIENRNIVVPLDDETQEDIVKRNRVAQAAHCFQRSPNAEFTHTQLQTDPSHPLLDSLRDSKQAGIILFTSGSTGESKAAVHAFNQLVGKLMAAKNRKPLNAMIFLKFDHIGGVNTMFSILMNGGRMIPAEDRSPEAICRLVEEEGVELLPTTPSFLNMLILSGAREKYNLSSLKLMTYGTEPMPESTLRAITNLFPDIKLKQTYGLTELGIFPTRSRSNDSTFMEIREEDDIQTKIENGVLYIKAASAMLGYLNAPSPFDQDGWYDTGDRVIVEDGYTRILGRGSEIINVGGEKVFPSEVESVLLEMDNVADVTVTGKPSPIVGHIVMAVFKLENKEELADLRKRVSEFCKGRLEAYKIPRQIAISEASLISGRLKKQRKI